MWHSRRVAVAALAAVAAAAVVAAQQRYGPSRSWWGAGQGGFLGWDESYDNVDGQTGIWNRNGAVRTDGHPFFEPLGTNGRACITCHQPANAMGISAAALRERWNETGGKDPVFAAIDGSNCPDLPQYEARSHSLLLEKGLFRIALPWPPPDVKPDFQIEVVRDPTGCNTGAVYGIAGEQHSVSVYRRPRIAANLRYLVAGPDGLPLMADGREPTLHSQAATAIRIHEQAARQPAPQVLNLIVAFESQIFAAQVSDIRGGLLTEKDAPALLGPERLASGKAGTLAAFSFDAWREPGATVPDAVREFRASVARGSEVFQQHFAKVYSCAYCHAAAVGTTEHPPSEATPDLPLFRIRCAGGEVRYTQDPGRALITGRCADVGAIVVQQLRGLASRAPYFANGSARTLRDVVEFYEQHFGFRYREQEKQDLVNFLKVL
jgi:mono/diheme cytochrome c family protein